MNLNDTQQRIRSTTIAVLVGLTVLFLVLDSTGNLDTAFAFLRNPMAALMDWTGARAEAVAQVFEGPMDVREAELRIAELEQRNAELERENARLRERQSDYQLYVEMFNRASEAPEYQRVTAAVIAQDTSPRFRSIIIDKGTADGVAVGMPVEGARGLIGEIYRAHTNTAQVILITDNASSIAGRLSTSRADGMVFGTGIGSELIMDWIDLEAQVETGDIVLTSGLGGHFPADLVIGEVVEVERSEAEILQRAVIQPAENLGDLEMIFVITSFEPVDTSVYDSLPENIVEP